MRPLYVENTFRFCAYFKMTKQPFQEKCQFIRIQNRINGLLGLLTIIIIICKDKVERHLDKYYKKVHRKRYYLKIAIMS